MDYQENVFCIIRDAMIWDKKQTRKSTNIHTFLVKLRHQKKVKNNKKAKEVMRN